MTRIRMESMPKERESPRNRPWMGRQRAFEWGYWKVHLSESATDVRMMYHKQKKYAL